MAVEIGFFFCNNCGQLGRKDVTFAQKPEWDCPRCNFNDWIFEPTSEIKTGADPAPKGASALEVTVSRIDEYALDQLLTDLECEIGIEDEVGIVKALILGYNAAWDELEKNDALDPEGLAILTPAFDPKKFYFGRAIRLEGTNEEGDGITGNYIITSNEYGKKDVLEARNVHGSGYAFPLHLFLPSIDDEEEPPIVYPPSIQVTFYGEDKEG